MPTIQIKDDTLGAWSQDEQGAFAEGVVFWEQPHNRVVPGCVRYFQRHRHTVQLPLQKLATISQTSKTEALQIDGTFKSMHVQPSCKGLRTWVIVCMGRECLPACLS